MDNIADRFEASAMRWAKAVEKKTRAYPIPKGSLDADASKGYDLDREDDAVAVAGVRLLAGQAITSASLEVYALRRASESPIELPLALALVTVARHDGVSVKIIEPPDAPFWGGSEWGDPFEPTGNPRFADYFLRIEPQAQLGDYRVDFLLTLEGTFQPSGERARNGTKRMVVECDGHDFHERTREQAKRDRERDRQLQSFGFLVYRFTGREIWEDVFACAKQAVDDLTAAVRATLSPT
jgi:very-short-patch-repair endonuclease